VILIPSQGAPRLAVAAIGDVGLVGSARARARHEGYDAPLALPGATLAAADLGFANLEFPVGESGWVRPGRSNEFFHDPEICGALRRAGVQIVSLATNHTMDCGPRGLERTLTACRAAGLDPVGAGLNLAAARQPARLEVRGRKVVVLAYAQATKDTAQVSKPGVAPLHEAILREDLARWRPEADVLVVSAHWGSMYVDYPPPRVLALAKLFAEGGVDLVLGHHPHVMQGAERRENTLVLYSLGDGVFNCRAGDFHASIAAETRLPSGVFTARLADGAHGLEYAPYRLDPDGFPAAVDAATAMTMGERVTTLSMGLEAAAEHFAAEEAPRLLRYELESVGHYLRQGRLDKIVKLLLSVRPRHLPLLRQSLRRRARAR
jgi:poly-gamma-glutamate synthesis protein (capsule biosynthesis protein)